MINNIKRIPNSIISSTVKLIAKTKLGGYVLDQALNSVMNSKQVITHGQNQLTFATPNRLNKFRVNTFSNKEPETLEWIDGFVKGSVIWDIGANVGLYSCYAAKARNCQVFAFEPSVFNFELLARNIFLNDLTSRVAILPLPLSDTMALSTLNMTSTEWGGALSTFGKDFGWDGNIIQQVFKFKTLGISIDDAAQLLQLPPPNYIKIDVDGIEHLILDGARNTLKNVESVLIEVNDAFYEQAEQCNKLLIGAGFVLKEKRRAEYFDNTDSFGGGNVWNQIWIKNKISDY